MRRTLALVPAVLAVAAFASGCGSSSSDSVEPADWNTSTAAEQPDVAQRPADEPYPTREVAKGWPKLFCAVEVGMSRDEAREIMGRPVEEYADSEANQDSWTGFNMRLTAFYDVGDEVIQLDDSTGDANLPCSKVRGGGASSSKGAIPHIALDLDE